MRTLRLRLPQVLTAAAALVTVLFLARCATSGGGEDDVRDSVYLVGTVLAGLAIAARAACNPTGRGPWVVFSLVGVAWMAGNSAYAMLAAGGSPVPVPSIADAMWLLVPLLGGAGAVMLIRGQPVERRPWMRLDAALAVTTLASVSAALVLEPAAKLASAESLAGFVTILAYPIADLSMMSMLVTMLIFRRWTMSPAVVAITGSLVVLAVTDAVFMSQTASGTYVAGGLVDAGWLIATLGVAIASQLDVRPARSRPAARFEQAMPVSFAALALTILILEALGESNPLTIAAASFALVAAVGRMAASMAENRALLAESRQEAMTDPLTGLGNRRRLLRDLATWQGEPVALTIFDLDGFKTYNDTYGHGAGDELLQRIGEALVRSCVPAGRVYRMGGDEFSALMPLEADIDAIAAGLTQAGDGFSVTASHGTAHLPADSTDPDDALRIADARMYAHKFRRRGSAGRQSADVLLAVLHERSEELARHGDGVATLTEEVAAALGVDEYALDQIRHAACLHDIGKLAIPEAILGKPGRLNETEWAFMRRHTLIGERILRAAPSLSPVAAIVRASHERWDGRGYPDGVPGSEIPLGARIIFVCDALDAMTEDRVYRAAMPLGEALEELQANAGTQFDPAVVRVVVRIARERLAVAA